jgi:hypothetical protein
MSAKDEARQLRKRIGDLHAHLGGQGPDADSFRDKLLILLHENGKSWSVLAVTLQVGFEQLVWSMPQLLSLSLDELNQHPRRHLTSFAHLVSAPADVQGADPHILQWLVSRLVRPK